MSFDLLLDSSLAKLQSNGEHNNKLYYQIEKGKKVKLYNIIY